LEQTLDFIREDECIEVTPESIHAEDGAVGKQARVADVETQARARIGRVVCGEFRSQLCCGSAEAGTT
jgi:hypothetical protein